MALLPNMGTNLLKIGTKVFSTISGHKTYGSDSTPPVSCYIAINYIRFDTPNHTIVSQVNGEFPPRITRNRQ